MRAYHTNRILQIDHDVDELKARSKRLRATAAEVASASQTLRWLHEDIQRLRGRLPRTDPEQLQGDVFRISQRIEKWSHHYSVEENKHLNDIIGIIQREVDTRLDPVRQEEEQAARD